MASANAHASFSTTLIIGSNIGNPKTVDADNAIALISACFSLSVIKQAKVSTFLIPTIFSMVPAKLLLSSSFPHIMYSCS